MWHRTTCEKPFEAAENNLRRMLDKSRIWLENKKLDLEDNLTNSDSLVKESKQFLHTCLALVSCFLNNKKMEDVAVVSFIWFIIVYNFFQILQTCHCCSIKEWSIITEYYIYRDKAVVAPPTSLRKRYNFLLQMSQSGVPTYLAHLQ